MSWIARCLLSLSLLLVAAGAMAEDSTRVGALIVEGAWTRPIGAGARTTAVHLTIRNTGGAADRLVSATSEMAERVELHVHRHEGNVARMVAVPAITVPAHGQAALAPGAAHVMLIGPKGALVEGAQLRLTLTFEKSGGVSIDVPVRRRPPEATTGDHGAGHGPQRKN